MANIAVDIDDTLYSFNQLAREMFIRVALEKGDKRLQRGAYCAWGEWRSPSDVIDEDYWGEIITLCHLPEVVIEQTPFPGAAETLRELVAQGNTLRYISNRHPDSVEATDNWLIDWSFPEGELICTMEDKMPFIADCQYIIDDRPKTLVQFIYNFDWQNKYGSTNADKQRLGFGIMGDYNRALTDVPGVYLAPTWTLLRQYLIEKGVLDAS